MAYVEYLLPSWKWVSCLREGECGVGGIQESPPTPAPTPVQINQILLLSLMVGSGSSQMINIEPLGRPLDYMTVWVSLKPEIQWLNTFEKQI